MAAAGITRRIITSPHLPKPLAPYSHGVQIGNTLYISGQIGIDIKGEFVTGGVVPEARQTLTNVGHVLAAAGTSFKNVTISACNCGPICGYRPLVVKVNVLLADMKDFEVVNTVYREFFTDRLPTRVMFQAAGLPKNARIEIEALAVVGDITEIQ